MIANIQCVYKTWHKVPLVVAQVPVLEPEVTLLSHTPAPFPVKVQVLSLLVLIGYFVRFRMSLEPCQKLDVESPRLLLEFLRSQPLLIRSRHVVEYPEQSLYIQPFEKLGRREER